MFYKATSFSTENGHKKQITLQRRVKIIKELSDFIKYLYKGRLSSKTVTVNNTFYCGMFIYRLVMISIDLSETTHFVHWKSETTSKTILFGQFFFQQKFFCQIFSQTEFCLELNFVLDYIPQLYFVCNHLIVLCS